MIHQSPHPPVEIPDVPLADFVLAGAAARGERPALVDAASGRTLTYAGLDALARGIASGLQRRGLEPGHVVGILAPNVPEYAAAFFGVALAGGTNTTINGLYTEAEIAHQLRSSRARFLFTVSAMLERAFPAAAAAGVEAVFSFDGGEGTTALHDMLGPPDELRAPAIDPATALVALPYSSGTTGLPKGVMLTHRNLVANVVQTLAVMPGGDEVVAGILPFFHIYGQTAVMNCALRAGDTVVTLPRFDFEVFLRMIAEHRVTRAYVAPPIVVALSKHPAVERYDLSSLRMINSGAAPLGDDLEAACRARVPARLQQGYGLTEASPVTHITPLSEEHRPGTIGQLVPNTEARIVKVGTREDAASGEPGELWVRGPQVMTGYLDDPAATARTLDRRRLAAHRRHRHVPCRGLADRRPAEGADQVQGLPGRPGDARGAPAHASGGRRRVRDPGRRRGRGRDPEGVRGRPRRGHGRRADGLRRRARRPARAHPRARADRRDPQVGVGQAAAPGARRARAGAGGAVGLNTRCQPPVFTSAKTELRRMSCRLDRDQVVAVERAVELEQPPGLAQARAVDRVSDAAGIREARPLDPPLDVLAEGRLGLGAQPVGAPLDHHPADRHQLGDGVVGEVDVVGDPRSHAGVRAEERLHRSR